MYTPSLWKLSWAVLTWPGAVFHPAAKWKPHKIHPPLSYPPFSQANSFMTEDQHKVRGLWCQRSLDACYVSGCERSASAQRERPPGTQICLLPLERLAPERLNFPTHSHLPRSYTSQITQSRCKGTRYVLRLICKKLDTNPSFKNK